ncbi:MAG: hypothetical protein A2W98_08410 [Bacteroidetes bacterium GWF2_33_38]|nr:MAG: hypothetical protein A2W98_08410 [Bacteroidetes bacterium GWF2_33_38]OFY88025.1 MAG: hypothetical protein A2236_04775 [Bacteroidetes bacterium RIFOXYA2_FULL_33_7]
MKFMLKVILITVFFISGYGILFSQETKNEIITSKASIVNDFSSNLMGGIKQGSVVMGLIDLSLTFNTENAKLWKSGEFFIHAQNTHGGNITGDYVGDIQTLSNIENGNYTYLYELYYSHNFEKLRICAGIHDLNSEILTSDFGALYLNSSFGIMPSISMNTPVAIFPHNALALVLNYNVTDNIKFTGGIYDGNPGSLDDNKYGFELNLNKDDGFFAITETKYSFLNSEIEKGFIKFGGYYSSMKYQDLSDSTSQIDGNYGVYLITNYMIKPHKDDAEKGLGIHFQAGIVPSKTNNFNSHVGFGFNYKGICNKKDDELGLGITYLSLSKYTQNNFTDKYEIAIELTYNIQLNEHFSIQPDIHYILNPGMVKSIDNAFVASLRTNVSF